ncbi:MAG: ABC transporter permease [Pseudohongiella sp.]|uniref:ABC transporter permease n=1 Tax=Pseudohongiella sp. TaxID=1979412 RepID=UPI00349FD937
MRVTLLIAWREYMENIKTKGFWLGVLLVPIIFFLIYYASSRLATATPTRYYMLIDQSGEYAAAVENAIRREHQRRVMQDFMRYLQDNLTDVSAVPVSAEPSSQLDQLMESFANDEVAALDEWLSNGSLNFALTLVQPYLREGAAEFIEPRPQFIAVTPPPDVDPGADAQDIVAQLRPYLNGERGIDVDGEQVSLFALILIPTDVDQDIVRPATIENLMTPDDGPRGVQYWAGNLTDARLSSAIQNSINSAIREQEYTDRDIDVNTVRNVQRTRLPLNRLDPSKAAGQEEVSRADTFRQWAPMGFVYLIFISLMQSVQYLLSNTIEEKSNRIIEVLLASVTPGELLMGKLLGIGLTGITTILAWIGSFFVFIRLYQTVETAMIVQVLDVLLSSDLIPYFVFYYLCCYALYAGIFLAIGSLCNTLKEAQSLMMPLMAVLVVPILTMSFIAQDPNGTLARVMSWIPLFTPFTMMNRAAAQPPMFDVVGTTVVLVLTTAAVLWLSGRVFRQGILRSGQPPRIIELWRMLRRTAG